MALDECGRVADARELDAADMGAFAGWAADAGVIAIDAPDALSTLPHAGDMELSPKFRAARCGEVALGREHRYWVSWVTPAERPVAAWMEVGFAAHEVAGARGIEVYPYAAFRELAGGRRLAKKTTAAGRAERVALLREAGVEADAMEAWSHHLLDAAAAALVALHRGRGTARRVSCGHDASAIWLP